MIARADAALYSAKAEGRDMVVLGNRVAAPTLA
jgi:PleD family two-component response regulator